MVTIDDEKQNTYCMYLITLIRTFYGIRTFPLNVQSHHIQEQDTWKKSNHWESEYMRLKMNYVSIHYLNGSASVPSFGRLFGLFALGHPERLQ